MTTAPPWNGDVPKRRPGVRLDLRPDGCGRLITAEGTVHLLNDTAVALWQLCDGETTTEEMAASVCVVFRADREAVHRDLRQILTSLHAAELIQWEPQGVHHG